MFSDDEGVEDDPDYDPEVEEDDTDVEKDDDYEEEEISEQELPPISEGSDNDDDVAVIPSSQRAAQKVKKSVNAGSRTAVANLMAGKAFMTPPASPPAVPKKRVKPNMSKVHFECAVDETPRIVKKAIARCRIVQEKGGSPKLPAPPPAQRSWEDVNSQERG